MRREMWRADVVTREREGEGGREGGGEGGGGEMGGGEVDEEKGHGEGEIVEVEEGRWWRRRGRGGGGGGEGRRRRGGRGGKVSSDVSPTIIFLFFHLYCLLSISFPPPSLSSFSLQFSMT